MEKHNDIIKEILRQLCHPITGITKNLSPAPLSIDDWNKCLPCVYGWINIGIDEKTANIFHELKIGEVIPSSPANLNIYTYGFATYEIAKILQLEQPNKDYRAILNYYSFFKLINIILNPQDNAYQINFKNSLKLIFNDIDPKTFWLNILVTEQIAGYLKSNEIGEVIVKEGIDDNNTVIQKNNNLPTVWENINNSENKLNKLDEKDEIEELEELDEIEELEELDEIKDLEDILDDNVFEDDSLECDVDKPQIPYRLLMNNTTFLKLINSVCIINNSMYKHLNLFQLMGGESEDFSGLFGKMQI
jgi:hypothetical protein